MFAHLKNASQPSPSLGNTPERRPAESNARVQDNTPPRLVAWRHADAGVQLRWFDPSSHVADYKVLRQVGSGPWVALATRGALDRSHTDASASRGEECRYMVCRVEPHLGAGSAADRWSNIAFAPEAYSWRERLDRWKADLRLSAWFGDRQEAAPASSRHEGTRCLA